MPDDDDRFPIILLQDITQKSAHAVDDHQQALPVREGLPDTPRELVLYLSHGRLRQVTILVLAEPGI
jgi:hypothetical protein